MANGKIVQTLLDYFTNPVYQKHGPSVDQPMGSGPGGAAATNMGISKATGNLVKDGLMDQSTAKDARAQIGLGKLRSDTRDMKVVGGIEDAAKDALVKPLIDAAKKKQRFKYNMLSAPDDAQQDM